MTTVERFEQNIDQVNSDFQAIKSKLIECGVAVPEGTRTAELAEKVGQVYEAAKDAWWDGYQQNGNRTDYSMAFSGVYWTAENFKPKYDIKPIGTEATYMMFRKSIQGDLAALLNKLGITLDFSGVIGWESYTFAATNLTRIGKIDFSNATTLYATFTTASSLQTIDELCVSAKTNFNGVFQGCTALVNLTISGTIGQNGFNVSPCTLLSKASITSIINALSDTTSGLTVTLSQTAVDNAFKDGDRVGSESQEWETLAQTKSNWTISLI